MQLATRRRFLLASAGCVAAAAAGSAGWIVSSRSSARELQLASRTSRALGSQVSITALHKSQATADSAIDAALAELETVESVMSIYRPESQLSRLNREGVLKSPHPYLLQVLRQAESVSRQSNGAFDVTVQPLWELYATSQKAARLPDEAALNAARAKVDWRKVAISTNQVSLSGSGMAITLNGIAQGFAADRALAALQEHGVEHALVDTGELAPAGTNEQGKAWTAGIQHPREPEAYLALAQLAGRCLATSGDYATNFSTDRKYNHLFDPRTGRSPEEFTSVSIVAPTAMQADALSTALFVLGLERGLELINRLEGVDALLVLKNGRTRATAGFPQQV